MEKSELFNFIKLLHQFANVKRTVKLKGREEPENDAEHSFLLAMTAWFMIDKFKLDLDREKVFSYALSHDLPEVYAGDTDPHTHSQDFIDSKHMREVAAMEKLNSQFPDFSNLQETMKKYEALADKESNFVYLLDKVLPVINTFIAQDSYYADNKVSIERWNEWTEEKKKKSTIQNPEMDKFLEELKNFLSRTEGLFYNQ